MYPTGTTFRYFLSDSVKHYTAVMLKDGRVLEVKNPDSTEKETYEDLDEWLMSLPGDVHESDLSINGAKQERFTPEEAEQKTMVENETFYLIRRLHKFKNYLYGTKAVIKALYDLIITVDKLSFADKLHYIECECMVAPFINGEWPSVYDPAKLSKFKGDEVMAKWKEAGKEILKVMPNILTELEKEDLDNQIQKDLKSKKQWEGIMEYETKRLNRASEAVKKTTELLNLQTDMLNKHSNNLKGATNMLNEAVEKMEKHTQRLQELSH